jgi:uncharacterized protein
MTTAEPASQQAVLEALLMRLGDPAVRDLAWLLLGAPLVSESAAGAPLANAFESDEDLDAGRAWLLALDRNPAPLAQTLAAAKPVRLGRYAECLLAYFLEHGPAARLVAANVAVRRAGRTLGECDFLVESASGRRLHWELAVKCYLHVGTGDGSFAGYVGPNLLDRFDVKLARLIEHQLRLSAREEFALLGHAGPWEAQMFVKGWLFYRWKDGALRPAPPQSRGIDPRHARGFWVTRADWPRFAAQWAELASARPISGCAWAVLPRLAWLAPRRVVGYEGSEAAGLSTSHAIAERLAGQGDGGNPSPEMVAAFVNGDCNGDYTANIGANIVADIDTGVQTDIAAEVSANTGPEGSRRGEPLWRECMRGFIVPDDWPDRACAFAARAYHQR